MSFQSEFMDAVKNRFVEIIGDCEFGGTPSIAQAPYYVANLNDNLVVPMNGKHTAEYCQGSGKELDSKMKSLRSSSAMTFNLLGSDPIEITPNSSIPNGTYEVTFEYQLPTLSSNPNPANLDAFLVSNDGKAEIYCEMKMAEWILGKASGLRSAYLDPACYAIPEKSAVVFANIFKSLCLNSTLKDGRIMPILTRYDAFQMLKHALGIYSDCFLRHMAKLPLPPDIRLINCVWEMTNPPKLGKYEAEYRQRLNEEHEQYAFFAQAATPIEILFADLGIIFKLAYMSFSEFEESLVMDAHQRKKLQRYTV